MGFGFVSCEERCKMKMKGRGEMENYGTFSQIKNMSPVQSREELVLRLSQNKEALCRMGVVRLGLFGSFARGEQTPESDVDLLVEFSPDSHTFHGFMELVFFLEDLLGRSVEVVTPQALSPYIGPAIMREVQYIHVAS